MEKLLHKNIRTKKKMILCFSQCKLLPWQINLDDNFLENLDDNFLENLEISNNFFEKFGNFKEFFKD